MLRPQTTTRALWFLELFPTIAGICRKEAFILGGKFMRRFVHDRLELRLALLSLPIGSFSIGQKLFLTFC